MQQLARYSQQPRRAEMRRLRRPCRLTLAQSYDLSYALHMPAENREDGQLLLKVVTECHRLLDQLAEPMRVKAIKMLMLAFDSDSHGSNGGITGSTTTTRLEIPSTEASRWERRTQHWMKRFAITDLILERVFDVENDFALI